MAKRGRKPSGPKTLEDKINSIDVAFVSEVRTSTVESIKERMIKLDRYEVTLLETRKEDMDLRSKKEAAKVAGETYTEGLKATKMKRQFMLQVLSEKGAGG